MRVNNESGVQNELAETDQARDQKHAHPQIDEG